jgi:hypothetical protein
MFAPAMRTWTTDVDTEASDMSIIRAVTILRRFGLERTTPEMVREAIRIVCDEAEEWA